MGCPACGGKQRAELAPGFFECTTTITAVGPGAGFGAPPGGRYGAQYETVARRCGHRYQEGRGATGELCSARCGRYAVGRCVTCHAPVCGLCSAGNGAVLCRTHRAEREAADAAQTAELERIRAQTPEARDERARALARSQYEQHKAAVKAAGWKFEYSGTISVLREALPELRARAEQRREPVVTGKRRNRTVDGWRLFSYDQDSETYSWHHPDPEAVIYLVCDDHTVRVARTHFVGRTRRSELHSGTAALPLDTRRVKDERIHCDQQGKLLFSNATRIRWCVRELLGEATMTDLVLAELDTPPT